VRWPRLVTLQRALVDELVQPAAYAGTRRDVAAVRELRALIPSGHRRNQPDGAAKNSRETATSASRIARLPIQQSRGPRASDFRGKLPRTLAGRQASIRRRRDSWVCCSQEGVGVRRQCLTDRPAGEMVEAVPNVVEFGRDVVQFLVPRSVEKAGM
jgi:hypothetical protein